MTDAEVTVRKIVDEIAEKEGYKNHDVHLKCFNTAGANYTSVLFAITVSSPAKEDLKLFAKVACMGTSIREAGYVDLIFSTEQQFYNHIVPAWKKLQDRYELSEEDRYAFPKFYASIPEVGFETVVLEDLVADGFTTYPRMQSVTWEYAAKSAEVLAKFHALSFIHRRENPEEYDELAGKLKFPMPPDDESSKNIWTKMITQPLALLEEDVRQKVQRFLGAENITEKILKYNSPRRHQILIHGDYRPSNLMHKEQDGELKIVPVDFQTIHIGCPVIDLIYFLFMGSDEEFRAKYWDQFLDHYYEQLSLQLTRFQMDPIEIYPREEFDEDMKEMLPYALIVGIMTLPVITVEAENAPQMSGDANLESFIVKPNELFANRFKGLVNDCLKRGVI